MLGEEKNLLAGVTAPLLWPTTALALGLSIISDNKQIGVERLEFLTSALLLISLLLFIVHHLQTHFKTRG
jgi:hypothetical protein